jgi:minor extracellular serine protease Vpr
MVAPGAYINTTQNNAGYNFTSGTSYAAPHVSGAAALLMEKYPSIHHHEIKSLLLTTSAPVSDAYGKEFSLNDKGSGRLDIAKAIQAKLIIMPPNFVTYISSDKPTVQQEFQLKLLGGTLDNMQVIFEGPEFIQFAYWIEDNTLKVKLKATGEEYGEHEGKIFVIHEGTKYVIPFLLHYTESSISVTQENGKLDFGIFHPKEWSFAKISVTNSKDEVIDVTSATPKRDASIQVFDNTEYWIEAKIKSGNKTFDAFNTIQVNSVTEKPSQLEFFKIPQKQIMIISVIVVIVGAVGLGIHKRKVTEEV